MGGRRPCHRKDDTEGQAASGPPPPKGARAGKLEVNDLSTATQPSWALVTLTPGTLTPSQERGTMPRRYCLLPLPHVRLGSAAPTSWA